MLVQLRKEDATIIRNLTEVWPSGLASQRYTP